MFISNINDLFMGIIQYNKPHAPTDIDVMCDNFIGSSDPYDMMIKFVKSKSGGCFDINYQDFIDELKNETYSAFRSWLWQTCSEFGFYQTSNSKNQIFGNYLPLEFSVQMCKDIYGYDATDELMDETNSHYGGLNQKGSNIFWTNGGIDPWSAISVTESDTQDVVVIPV